MGILVEFRWHRGTPERWAETNEVLAPGEPGLEIDHNGVAGKFKIGDGITPWNNLDYYVNENGVASMIQLALSDFGEVSGDPRIGSMSELTTDAKNTLVAAINELNAIGISFLLLYENAKAG